MKHRHWKHFAIRNGVSVLAHRLMVIEEGKVGQNTMLPVFQQPPAANCAHLGHTVVRVTDHAEMPQRHICRSHDMRDYRELSTPGRPRKSGYAGNTANHRLQIEHTDRTTSFVLILDQSCIYIESRRTAFLLVRK
ncbi:unnamed protein product [Dicrocoelium dendriticum]|nr:unnamed protein product [Dicrocoelium dendriticum]